LIPRFRSMSKRLPPDGASRPTTRRVSYPFARRPAVRRMTWTDGPPMFRRENSLTTRLVPGRDTRSASWLRRDEPRRVYRRDALTSNKLLLGQRFTLETS